MSSIWLPKDIYEFSEALYLVHLPETDIAEVLARELRCLSFPESILAINKTIGSFETTFRGAFDDFYNGILQTVKKPKNIMKHIIAACMKLAVNSTNYDFILVCAFIRRMQSKNLTLKRCYKFSLVMNICILAVFFRKFQSMSEDDLCFHLLYSYCESLNDVIEKYNSTDPTEVVLSQEDYARQDSVFDNYVQDLSSETEKKRFEIIKICIEIDSFEEDLFSAIALPLEDVSESDGSSDECESPQKPVAKNISQTNDISENSKNNDTCVEQLHEKTPVTEQDKITQDNSLENESQSCKNVSDTLYEIEFTKSSFKKILTPEEKPESLSPIDKDKNASKVTNEHETKDDNVEDKSAETNLCVPLLPRKRKSDQFEESLESFEKSTEVILESQTSSEIEKNSSSKINLSNLSDSNDSPKRIKYGEDISNSKEAQLDDTTKVTAAFENKQSASENKCLENSLTSTETQDTSSSSLTKIEVPSNTPSTEISTKTTNISAGIENSSKGECAKPSQSVSPKMGIKQGYKDSNEGYSRELLDEVTNSIQFQFKEVVSSTLQSLKKMSIETENIDPRLKSNLNKSARMLPSHSQSDSQKENFDRSLNDNWQNASTSSWTTISIASSSSNPDLSESFHSTDVPSNPYKLSPPPLILGGLLGKHESKNQDPNKSFATKNSQSKSPEPLKQLQWNTIDEKSNKDISRSENDQLMSPRSPEEENDQIMSPRSPEEESSGKLDKFNVSKDDSVVYPNPDSSKEEGHLSDSEDFDPDDDLFFENLINKHQSSPLGMTAPRRVTSARPLSYTDAENDALRYISEVKCSCCATKCAQFVTNAIVKYRKEIEPLFR